MIYKPSDFWDVREEDNGQGGSNPVYKDISDISNKLFNEWLDKQPVVYRAGDDVNLSWWPKEFGHDTHRARLVCIEPIVTEHECAPEFISRPVCKICGTHLKMKWERVK